MDRDSIRDYDFSEDILPPNSVMEHLRAHDSRMDDDQPTMALAKASYTTNFWKFIDSQEEVSHEMTRLDQVEVNRIKPALSGYLSALYPRRIETVIGDSPYTTGDAAKAEMVVNDWLNQPRMRERILTASRQALLYKGSGAKIGYDPAGEGLDRVWMRVFPYWEMVMDSDVHDWEDARFIGHVSFKTKKEVIEQYELPENISGRNRDDFLSSYLSDSSRLTSDTDNANSDSQGFVRVLEFCNLVDDFYDTDGTRYKGRLEIYVIDEGNEGEPVPVFMGPLPLVDAKGQPMAHIVPLIFEHEPEYPYRGIAYSAQLMPQQKELNALRSFQASASRRDSRVYITRAGALDADSYSDLRSGEDGIIIEVDEQFAGNLRDVVVPIQHGPVSANILNSMQMAERDLERSTTISPAALGVVTKATAAEIQAVEGHTESEFGRHAEMRDLWLLQLVHRCLSAHVAAMYDTGDSEGGDADIDEEGNKLTETELNEEREDAGIRSELQEGNSPVEEEQEDEDDEEEEEPEESDEEEEESPQREEEEPYVEEERRSSELLRPDKSLLLKTPDGEVLEVSAEDLDSDFDIGFTEGGRTPMADAEMRQNLVALSQQLLALFEMSQQGGPQGMYAEELLKSIHERFNLPPNLHPDYIKGRMAEEPPEAVPAPEGAPVPGPAPAPEEAPAPESAPPEEIDQVLAQIEQMPPDQALLALEDLLAEAPEEIRSLVEQAKTLPPEQQVEAVGIIIRSLRGQ
tara:strand:- start:1082 stop:3313 length:2232 start_codon:yes stop_codon:yes gene_type:complete